MLVRITTLPTQISVDGIRLSRFKMGCVYSLPPSLATLMIVEGWAEPVVEPADLTLPEFSLTVLPGAERRRRALTSRRLREFGIAADRRRRRN